MSTTEQVGSPEPLDTMSATAPPVRKVASLRSSTPQPSPPEIQVGTVLIQDGVLLPDGVLLDTDVYTAGWRTVRTIDSFGLDRKIRAAGWTMFAIAGEFKTMGWGSTASGLRRALIHALATVRAGRFNAAEVTAVAKRHFMGIPYTSVKVQARHIQHSYLLEVEGLRSQAQQDTDWARG